MYSTSALTGLKPCLEQDFHQQSREDVEKTDRKQKFTIPEGFEVVGVHVPPLPDFMSKEEVERMKNS